MSETLEAEPDDRPEDRRRKLAGRVRQDLADRQAWTARQATWYEMRHDGLRRYNRPFPGASDLHYPLADSIIDKLKPFYFNQLFGTERIAEFVPKEEELIPWAVQTSEWFDFKLKQQSNLEVETLLAIDKMLMAGHAPMMVYWDADKRRLAFDAIEPSHCIVPEGTRLIEDADRVTIVHQMSVDAYKRDERYPNKDLEFIRSISGQGVTESGEAAELDQERMVREGITHLDDENRIVVWEVWERGDDGGWTIHWLSPLREEEPLRPAQQNPFAHGKLPIVRFDCEVKDKGYYASRGIPERVGAFEAALCKAWNEKNDYMTFTNRPLFTSEPGTRILNTGNLRFAPGDIIPSGVSAVQMPPPPVSFDQEMVQTRQIAEQLIGMPDFGIGNEDTFTGSRTATEVNRISGVMGVSVDLRARMFRMTLGKLLGLAWETQLQYDKDAKFLIQGEIKAVDDQALKADAWLIMPNGSADSWNKQAQMQRAVQRKQLFQGSPCINQAELDKSILECDDPRLVKRLWVDPQEKEHSEYTAEAVLIPTLLLGLPVPPRGDEVAPPRVKCLLDFLRQRLATGPLDPHALNAIEARIAQLLQVMKRTNKAGALALAKEVDRALPPLAQAVMPPPPAPSAPAPPARLSVAIKFGDLTRSEQMQVLQAEGIQPADLQEYKDMLARGHDEQIALHAGKTAVDQLAQAAPKGAA